MSARHPVIAVTGSSGAGTTTTSLAFRKIFAQLNLRAAEVEGDSFHRYTRPEMDMAIRKARDLGKHISYFGPEANDFGLLEQTFREYGQSGTGQSRKYLHTYDEAVPWNQVPGTFTPWQPLPEPTDVLFYERAGYRTGRRRSGENAGREICGYCAQGLRKLPGGAALTGPPIRM